MWLQLADLMTGGFRDVVDHFEVIDCRYPYEYEGGHVAVSTASSSPPLPSPLLTSLLQCLICVAGGNEYVRGYVCMCMPRDFNNKCNCCV